jgi:glycine/D-amino acid oxidase-like deaminating enzyme
MTKTTDVVIRGAGITGSAAATGEPNRGGLIGPPPDRAGLEPARIR